MKPVSPVVPGSKGIETIFAKNQPQYLPLPGVRSEDGCVTTRWSLSWKERLQVLFGGCIWMQLLTFNHPLQPSKLMATLPEEFRRRTVPEGFGDPIVAGPIFGDTEKANG